MAIRVAINGFGRIGRSVFRILSDHPDMEVVCINDIFANEALAYLLKYDTVMGTFDKQVTFDDQAWTTGGLYVLASVLDRFLALHATVNSFVRTEAVLRGRPGIAASWPARGQRRCVRGWPRRGRR